MRLQDKVVIITGGGTGIGKALSLGLADEGAKIVAADINYPAAMEVADTINRKGGEALAVKTDVSDEKSTLEMAQKTVERFGKINVLINNAGLFAALGPAKPFDKIDIAEWDRVMAVNLRGPFLCCRAVVPHMKALGKGKIINLGSGTAYRGNAGRIHYVTSKGGIIGFTRAMALELAGTNITVNTLNPGSIVHDAPLKSGAVNQQFIDKIISMRAVKKIMRPEDLVGAAVFMASDECDFMDGESIIVDGGIAFI